MHFPILLAGLLLLATTVRAESLDSIAAIVNNEPITCYEIEQDTNKMLLQLQNSGASTLSKGIDLNRRSLDARVTKSLQLQKARKLGLSINEEELANALGKVESENGLLPGQLKEVLKQQGADFDEFKEDLHNQMLISKLINAAVRSKLQISEETISEYYRKYLASPKAYREVQLGQIFLGLPGEPSPEQLTRVRNTARSIRQQLLAGKDFTQLVAIHSESPDRQQQGIMGWFAHGGTAQRFAPALDLSVGGITEPIQSPVGFHILKALNERWQEPEVIGESYDEVHARHILLQIPSSSDAATRAKIRHRAETIAADMQGESDEAFATRATESSQGPSADRGGDLGWFKRGMMLPEFEKAAFSMQAGETSGIVETQYGLHIIRVVANRHVDPNSLQANRERIQQVLSNVEMQEQVPRWITSLRADATVIYRSCPDSYASLPAPKAVKNIVPQPSTSFDADLKTTLEQWRKAWSKQDVSAYFATYSAQFNPGKRFASLAAWKAARRDMIANKNYIRIQVQGVKIVRLAQARARIEFTQVYEADAFRSRDLKMLLLQKTSSGWKIIREMAAKIK